MRYVDGFVLAVPKKNLADYRKMASKAGKVWMEHGALEYLECAGDDLEIEHCMPFPKMVKPKPGETIFFSVIIYKSRAHRDKVNKKVMADPRMGLMLGDKPMPFDVKRMAYGGFKAIVDES